MGRPVATDRSISTDTLFQTAMKKGIESGMRTSPSMNVAATRIQKPA